MNAKNTVMNEKAMVRHPCWPNDIRGLLKAQAERTESMLKEQWKQEGMKEVVEWVEEHGNPEASYTGDGHIVRSWIELPDRPWQAFKKERGI